MRITDKGNGRKVVAVNFRLDLDAFELLKQYSPTTRARGHFLSRLLYEYQARQDERTRIQRQLAEVIGADHAA
jgi:hypothetical protein